MFKILKAGKHKKCGYLIDEIEFKDGKLTWEDKSVSKRQWEQKL